MNEAGWLSAWARLHAIHGGFWLEMHGTAPAWFKREYRDGFFQALPFFLRDLRPQGFLGRAAAKELSKRAALPPDPRVWNDDDVLDFLLHHGRDLAGNLIVSNPEVSTLPPSPPLFETERPDEYLHRATQVMQGEFPGSSAGGEQPKFITRVQAADNTIHDVLVKFSPPRSTAVGQRWADLLVAEQHALRILGEVGLPVADAQIINAHDRCFLEVRRFDRTSLGGRKGMISLEALVTGLSNADLSQNWVSIAETLLAERWIDAATLRQIRLAWCFGRLIGNTDMHPGNLSFWFGDDLPFGLTPIYDMLPMVYAPVHGELRPMGFEPPSTSAALQPEWAAAFTWALQFWGDLKNDSRISAGFRQEATRVEGQFLQLIMPREHPFTSPAATTP
jgi:hypothetical protein